MTNTIAGLAKLYQETMRLQEESGLPYSDAYEIVKARVKADLINQAQQSAPTGAPESVAPRRPMGRQIFQENEILRVIRELRYDPKALPKDTPGKSGIKAEVRALLPTFSHSVFKKAWERLSAAGDIIKPK